MSGSRLLLLWLLVMLAVGATASVSSAAAEEMFWKVNGTELKTGETAEIKSPATVTTSEIELAHVIIKCTGITYAVGSELEGKAGGKVKKLAFTGCAATSPGGCKISKTEIQTVPSEIAISLLLVGGLPFTTFLRPANENFAKIKFESNCGTLSGKTVEVTTANGGEGPSGEIVEAESQKVVHELNINEAPSVLETAFGKVERFVQVIKLELVSGLPYSTSKP